MHVVVVGCCGVLTCSPFLALLLPLHKHLLSQPTCPDPDRAYRAYAIERCNLIFIIHIQYTEFEYSNIHACCQDVAYPWAYPRSGVSIRCLPANARWQPGDRSDGAVTAPQGFLTALPGGCIWVDLRASCAFLEIWSESYDSILWDAGVGSWLISLPMVFLDIHYFDWIAHIWLFQKFRYLENMGLFGCTTKKVLLQRAPKSSTLRSKEQHTPKYRTVWYDNHGPHARALT